MISWAFLSHWEFGNSDEWDFVIGALLVRGMMDGAQLNGLWLEYGAAVCFVWSGQ